MSERLRLGTRGSPLARWQTDHVAAALKLRTPGLAIEIEVIKTAGDKILDVPLARIGDRGLFVKEIEEALLAGRIDAAVHSLKDLPTAQPDGLVIAAVLDRADARDCVVFPMGAGDRGLVDGAVVGTSSLRRKAQLRARWPHLCFKDVRGNLQTRLAKLDAGEYDALVLAAAGLQRLGLEGRISRLLDAAECVPAVGQGALAVECRADDATTRVLLGALDDAPTRICVTAERTLLRRLEGGCQVPIGAHCTHLGDRLALTAMVAALDGDPLLTTTLVGAADDPSALGVAAAEDLRARGAAAILASARDVTLP